MDDIAGLGKIIDSKLVAKAYEDAASPAAKEFGAAAADFMKTLRLFTAPFQLAAAAQDRLGHWLEQARSRVPADRQVEAPPTVSGPALRAMLFIEDDNPLAQMFINLLSQAIDRDKQKGVHPAFVRLLEQINPDEARLLTKLAENVVLGVQVVHIIWRNTGQTRSKTTFPQDDFSDPDSIYVYFDHLLSLSLVTKSDATVRGLPKEIGDWKDYKWFNLSPFGYRFLEVCGQIRSTPR